MKKEKVLTPIQKMQKDVKAGENKHKAWESYLATGGDIKQGSMALAMVADKAAVEKYGWMNYLILAMYWVPYGGLYLVNAVQGSFSLTIGHFFFLWPVIMTYFVWKRSAVSYYFFLYIIGRETYLAATRWTFDNALVTPTIIVYGVALFALAIATKMMFFSYQSFFHQKKNPDGTYVYTAEPKQEAPVAKKRKRRKK